MSELIIIKRALMSCWDKSGLLELAKALQEEHIEIISSGGTADYLAKSGLTVTPVEKVTGFREILDGRVKTLHPHIHAAILARRDKNHLAQLAELGIDPIDLVVVNLYPFVEGLPENRTLSEMIELIDIGGPTMLRAAAKNYENVIALHHPDQYKEFLDIWKKNGFKIPRDFSLRLASDLFFATSYYDSRITGYLDSFQKTGNLPRRISHFYIKRNDLRYGENPHQRAAVYNMPDGVGDKNEIEILWGKEMSYNNYVDSVAAGAVVEEFPEPCVAIVKHTNPCGAAIAEDLMTAFRSARAGDPVSAFGGIIAANRTIDEETARIITETFFECIIAPGYSESALNTLKTKKNLRIIKKNYSMQNSRLEFKLLPIGVLAQDADNISCNPEDLRDVTRRRPDEAEERDLIFGWKMVKHVKSNAIIFVKDRMLVGVGAGQMSRVDSVKLAGMKAREAGHSLQGAVMASDAFFPFRDGIDEAARLGIRAVIEPGGSVRDQEVIDACNEHDMAMKFTSIRHFKH